MVYKKEMWRAPVKDWIHDMYEKIHNGIKSGATPVKSRRSAALRLLESHISGKISLEEIEMRVDRLEYL